MGKTFRITRSQRSFTDIQTKGPFKLWCHRHEYLANADGVLVLDTVDYQLPFGIFGRLAHFMVRKNLEKLFDYRVQALDGLLFLALVSSFLLRYFEQAQLGNF